MSKIYLNEILKNEMRLPGMAGIIRLTEYTMRTSKHMMVQLN